MHGLLYVTLIVQPILGFLTTNAYGFPLLWFGEVQVWSPIGKNPTLAPLLKSAHIATGWAHPGAVRPPHGWRGVPPCHPPRRHALPDDLILEAVALWIEAPGRAALRRAVLPAVGADAARVRTLYSAISRGTERLVFAGRVPATEHGPHALSLPGGRRSRGR